MARLDVTEIFHGISFPGHLHTQDSLQQAVEFNFKDTDIIIVSYPKSGTTWMQEIVTLVSSKGDPHVCQTVPNWTRAPWLEQYYCAAVLEASSAAPRLLTTHLPYRLLRTAIQDSKAKVIYVSRNPKDVVVSFYHFHKMANFLPNIDSFPEFLHQFLEGKLHFGSWFDHIIGWTQTPAVDNLLHVTYEEMLQDPHGAVRKMSLFLQCPLVEDEVNNCVKHCSFSRMKDNKMINYTLVPPEIMDHSKGSFMRKGEIGDWKNMFTEEQSRHFDSVFSSRMQQFCLQFVWEKPDEEAQHGAEKIK
ncbi:unnamed protein product [Ophioblennius macclurei]